MSTLREWEQEARADAHRRRVERTLSCIAWLLLLQFVILMAILEVLKP